MTDDELIDRYVRPHPYRAGAAEAYIAEFGTPVWAIAAHYRDVRQNVVGVARDYEVPEEAIRAALAYYQRHRAAIDDRIAANAA